MRYLPKALVIAGITAAAFSAPVAQAEEARPSVKLSVYSEYEYRGISQTSEKPAGQLNVDWAHSSGFYLGTFVSNIKWLKDTAEAGGFSTSANIEWDIFGGYKFEVVKDVTLDVGYLRYEYPSSGAFNPKPNTDEVYAGVSYGPVSVKYSYSLNDTFGVPESKGSSDFIEANLAYPLTEKLQLTGLSATRSTRAPRSTDSTTATSPTPSTSWPRLRLGRRLERRRVREGHQRRFGPLHHQGQGLEQEPRRRLRLLHVLTTPP